MPANRETAASPTDTERLDFVLSSRSMLYLLANSYNWAKGTPEIRRAAVDLAMANSLLTKLAPKAEAPHA